MQNKSKIKGLGSLKMAGSNLQKTAEKIQEQGVEFSTENNISFSFTLDRNLVLFIKEIVFIRINESVENYHFNESLAVREGIQLLSENFPVKQRPEEIGNPTKRGRKSTATEGVVKVSTSFLISEADREFIYNFIYEKQKGGGRFTKEEFFILVVNQLENKYKIKYQG
ncbi:hypothetical protein NZD88_21070 [Chryseobacterium antibioticum]|uniref:Uncharacterized protein n=1 Tax=Chryseobacterium pyrolae TaxID=2987481 RepID=A0ABT2IN51_9FLAO|nr:hypothetical protein [Chryseobacterium pyrolae]MCT2410056.1 hypothetical protein [Chryseobacterium pyrolae]